MLGSDHWCERAEEMRAPPAEIRGPEAKATILRIAEDYEHLARRAEERLADGTKTQASLIGTMVSDIERRLLLHQVASERCIGGSERRCRCQ